MLYARRPAESLAVLGFKPSDYDETVEVWPENLAPLQLLQGMASQWNIVMGIQPHYIGLNYAALEPVAGALGLPLGPALFRRLQHAEARARHHLNS